MLPMTLRQMEVFTAVVRHGSTVAAAASLGLSQSATSAALQQLERVLGSALFERQGRSLVLNPAGRILLPQARSLLEQAQNMALSLGAAGTGTSAQPVHLHLAASSTIGNHVLPLVLADLMRSHPHIRIDLQIGNTEQVERAVQALEVDLGLTEGPCRTPTLQRHAWYQDELLLVARPGSRWVNSSGDISALRQAHWLLREPGSGTREVLEHHLLPLLQEWPANSSTLGSSEAIARCAALGLGVGCLSRVLVQPWLERGELVTLASPLPPLRRDFALVQRPAHALTAALTAFVQACHAYARRPDERGSAPCDGAPSRAY